MRTTAQRLALAHAGDRAFGQAADPVEHGDGGGAADAVGGQVHVALELDQRPGGVVAEDAVLATGVEAEPVEAALQLADVVAPEHRPAAVEQSVAEAVAALHDRRPRLGPADAVDPQAAGLLEGAHGLLGRVGERAGFDPGHLVTERAEADLEVADGLAVGCPAAARPASLNR